MTATYAYLLLTGNGTTLPAVLINSVVVVIAFYFGSRVSALGAPRPPPGGPAPLPPSGHPKVVRILLLLLFAGLAAWFLRQDPSLQGIPKPLLSVLEVLAGYVSGAVVAWIVHRRAHESTTRTRLASIFRDALAAGALGLTGYICYAFATGQTTVFASRAEDALSLVLTFYFGSRVIGH
ncbi:MAG: hypothetical protein L3J78_04055 [Thermoplasmata archaeon]|nr:hypothetical protein [Thermoplasmata archaeon]